MFLIIDFKILTSVILVPTSSMTCMTSVALAYLEPPVSATSSSVFPNSLMQASTDSCLDMSVLLTRIPARAPQKTEKIAAQKMQRGAIPNWK